ncbi:MAG: hypothetical protein KGI89_15700 [Euryarchaeota archaeon]|nr:hypothetical protein [Euryarchaeota archaeon]
MATNVSVAPNVSGATRYVKAGQGNVSTDQWARALLSSLNAPITANNLANVKLWLGQEQNASSWAADATNPLGVEQGGSVHPQTDVLSGIILTASTLLGSSSYSSIVSSLRNNAPTKIFSQAVISSPWSGTVYRTRGLSSFLSRGSLEATGGGGSGSGSSLSTDLHNWTHDVGSFLVNGAKTSFMVGLPAGRVIVPAVSNTVEAVSSVGGLISKISSPQFLKNLGIFVAGLALTVGGMVVFFSSTKTAHEAANLVPVEV